MAVAQGLVKRVVGVVQSALASPGSTGGQIFRRTSASFSLSRDTYESNEIVSHQQSTGATAGVQKTAGKLDGLISPGTYSKLFASLLRKDFVATTPITAASVTISGAGPTYTLVRAAGSWLTDGIKIGDVIRLSAGALNAANISKNLIVTAIASATSMTVKPVNAVALVAEGPITGTTITVTGKKSWVPTTSHTSDYWSFEEWYSDLSKSELFTDVKVAKADVTLPATGNASVSFDLPGLGRTLGTAAVLTTPTAESTTNVLTAVNGVVLVDGTATSITGAQISIDGHIAPGEAEVGSNSISDLIRGEVSVSGSFTAKFSSTTLQTLYANQTACSLVLVITDGTSATADFVTFVITNVKLFGDAADDGEAKEIVRTYPFTAAINGSGGAALANLQTIISVQDSQAA